MGSVKKGMKKKKLMKKEEEEEERRVTTAKRTVRNKCSYNTQIYRDRYM